MTTSMKKTLLIALGIFLTIVLAIAVVYMVRKPAPVVRPSPTPKASPEESAVTAPVFQVTVPNACEATFVVACGSSPSPSPSSSVSPSPSSSPSVPPSAALKCMAKKMYEDDTRNRSGFYYLEKEITDTNTLSNGQTIVYNVVSKNAGGSTVPDTTITDKLSENLTYVDGDSGCTYDSATRIVTCTIGSLSPNSEAQRSFRATVAVAGTTSVANTAEVSSTNGQRDSCSVRIDATGKVVTTATPAPTSLPVAGVFEVTAIPVGIGLLLLTLGGLGLLLL
jgi:fimbrial isopeptide formation D2 family protein